MPIRETIELEGGIFRVSYRQLEGEKYQVFLEICDKNGFTMIETFADVLLGESAEIAVEAIKVTVVLDK